MDAFQFYPTPKNLAAKAWAKFKNRNFVRILESSAGAGDLADGHPWTNDSHYRGTQPIIDCCEIDVTHHSTLRGKGYNVVGLDFLGFGNASIYAHCIMNPPFSSGATHVLKAWDAAWDIEIVAIINADTLRNPFSRERQRLLQIVEQFGEVEFIEGAFSIPEADRKTDVDIALVYLKKTADVGFDIVGDLMSDLREDFERGAGLAGDYQPDNAITLPNSFVENSVLTFNAAVLAMRESVRYEARARHYAARIGATMAVHAGQEGGGSVSKDHTADWVKGSMAERYDELKDRSWANLLRSADVTSRLSSAAQRRLESEFDNIKKLEYTVSNIRGFLCGLVDSQDRIQNEMICDCFDLISRYHTDNAVYSLGWKSNTKHRTLGMKIKTTRFILPGHSTYSWSSSLSWDSEKLLSDFDKCFALLDGKKEPEISLVSIFNNHFSDLRSGNRIYGSYFSVRWYPGAGTIHFFPTKPDLIDRLNRVVGRQRAWLPNDDSQANAAFWNAYENADKFDKEIRNEVAKKRRSRWGWDDPFRQVGGYGDEQRKDQAENEILDAISTVFERHGIQTDNLLEDARPAHPQLELIAA